VAAWQKLLGANPDYNNKDDMLQLIAQAQKSVMSCCGSCSAAPVVASAFEVSSYE
jgi:NADH:ubiquinone oxidoreductase subunit E